MSAPDAEQSAGLVVDERGAPGAVDGEHAAADTVQHRRLTAHEFRGVRRARVRVSAHASGGPAVPNPRYRPAAPRQTSSAAVRSGPRANWSRIAAVEMPHADRADHPIRSGFPAQGLSRAPNRRACRAPRR